MVSGFLPGCASSIMEKAQVNPDEKPLIIKKVILSTSNNNLLGVHVKIPPED